MTTAAMKAAKKVLKCNTKSFCEGMKLHFTEANRKGINPVLVFNLKTATKRVIGVAFKKSEKDRGIMLNFCPQCGTNLAFMLKSKGKAEK